MNLQTTTESLSEQNATTTEVPLNPSLLLRATADQSPTTNLPNAPSTSRPTIQWAEDTVDNEFMGKKKSNCCCIYEKPRRWDESSSSSSSSSSDGEDDGAHKKVKHIHCTEHCRGHTKRCYRKSKKSGGGGTNEPGPAENPDPNVQNS